MKIRFLVISACCAVLVLRPAAGTLLAKKKLAAAAVVAAVKKPFIALGLAGAPPPAPAGSSALNQETQYASTVYQVPAPTPQHTYGQSQAGEGSLRSQQWAFRRPAQTYSPPTQSYSPPAQIYIPPAQSYNPPAQSYGPPTQSYSPPAQSYNPPAQSYNPPAQSYGPPTQSYSPPAQSYNPPAQSYGPPTQSYSPPAQSYNPPAQSYGPPAQSYRPPAQPAKGLLGLRTSQGLLSGNRPQLGFQHPSIGSNLASLWTATQQAVTAQTNRARDRLQYLNPISYIGSIGNNAQRPTQLLKPEPSQVLYKLVPDVGFTNYNEIHYYPLKVVETSNREESKPSVPSANPTQEPCKEYKPTETYDTPKQEDGLPALIYGPPPDENNATSQRYTPGKENVAPAKEYGVPEKEYVAPNTEYDIPAKEYSTPEKVFSIPIKVYEALANEYLAPDNESLAPTNELAPPTQEYATPKLEQALPTNEYSVPKDFNSPHSVPVQYDNYPPLSPEGLEQYPPADEHKPANRFNDVQANEVLPATSYSYKVVNSKVY